MSDDPSQSASQNATQVASNVAGQVGNSFLVNYCRGVVANSDKSANPAKTGGGDDTVDAVYARFSGGALGGGRGRPPKRGRAGRKFGGDVDDEDGYEKPDEATLAHLRSREAALAAEARTKFVRALATALAEANLPGLSITADATLDEVAAALRKSVPDPSRPGGGFVADATRQAAACRTIAKVLNNQFTPGARDPADKFIDDTIEPAALCEQVGEFAHSFAAGINTDYMAVHATVRNVLARLKLLDELLARAYDHVAATAINSPDSEAGTRAAAVDGVYRTLRGEIRRATELLANIHHEILAPADAALATALADSANSRALVKRLGLKPGTSAFGSTIAAALTGLGTAAAVTAAVDRALARTGLSIDAYLAAKSPEDLERKLAELTPQHIADGTLETFIRAKNELTQMFARSHAHVKAARGGAVDLFGDLEVKKSPLERRLDQQKLDRKLVLVEFARQLSRGYGALLAAVNTIGPKFGRAVPVGAKLDRLRDAIKGLVGSQFGSADRLNEALIGLYADADATARKAQYVNALRSVARACDGAADVAGAGAGDIAAIKSAVESLEKTIDSFSDAVARKYGDRINVMPASVNHRRTGAGDDGQDDQDDQDGQDGVKGGDGEAAAEFATGSVTLSEAVGRFTYFYYIAHVRANLARTSVELDSFGADYAETLGAAMAERIFAIKTESTNFAAKISTPTDSTDSADFVKKFADNSTAADISMCKVAQAVDLYLKAFAKASASSPDDFTDIRAMLEETQMIARWFTETTGNKIVAAFERFGGNFSDENIATFEQNIGGQHYYKYVETTPNFVPADPTKPIQIFGQDGHNTENTQTVAAVKKSADLISESVNMYQGLKNLVSAFVHIGSRTAAAEVFMTPAQIYRDLVAYLKTSAIGMGQDYNQQAGNVAAYSDHYFKFRTVDDSPAVAANTTATTVTKAMTDHLFVLVVKAMAAKVLTTLGIFETFDKGAAANSIWPIRSILGGASAIGETEVIADASELYFRLPRLAEFYREHLLARLGANGRAIAMLPDASGVFGELIFKIFYQFSESSETGSYNDSEIREIVRTINRIHTHYSAKSAGTTAVVADFVAEVNRRYGIVTRSDVDNYAELIKQDRTGQLGVANETLFSILPGEDDFMGKPGVAPSDSFATAVASTEGVPRRDPYGTMASERKLDLSRQYIGDGHQAMLRTFRKKVDDLFQNPELVKQYATHSYAIRIRRAADDIRKATTSDKKIEIVTKLVTESSRAAFDDELKLMFNETVVFGLGVLESIAEIIDEFEAASLAASPDYVEELLCRIHAKCLIDGNFNPTLGDGLTNIAGDNFINAVVVQLPGKYRLASIDDDKALALRTIYRCVVVRDLSNMLSTGLFSNQTMNNIHQPGVVNLLLQIQNNNNGGNRPGSLDLAYTYVKQLNLYNIGNNTLCLNLGQMFGDAIDASTSLFTATGGLVEWSEGAGRVPRLSFAKLQSSIDSIFSDVKMFASLIGDLLPAEDTAQYLTGNGVGSLRSVEQGLVARRLREDIATGSSSKTLDALGAQMFKTLKQFCELSGTHAHFGEVFAERTHYRYYPDRIWVDQSTPETCPRATLGVASFDPLRSGINSLIRTAPIETGTNAIDINQAVDLSNLTMREGLWNGIPAAQMGATLAATAAVRDNFRKLYAQGFVCNGWTDMVTAGAAGAPVANAHSKTMLGLTNMCATRSPATGQRGLMFAVNQLVYSMLDACTEPSTLKIYSQLVSSLVNSTFGQAAGDPKRFAHPDLMPVGTTMFIRGDPKPNALVMQSVALILQRMSRDQLLGDYKYLYSVLIDVPVYMKEKYRVVLPYLLPRLDAIAVRAKFLQQLSATSVDMSRLDVPMRYMNMNRAGVNQIQFDGVVNVVTTVGTSLINACAVLGDNGLTTGTGNLVLAAAAPPIGPLYAIQLPGAMPTGAPKMLDWQATGVVEVRSIDYGYLHIADGVQNPLSAQNRGYLFVASNSTYYGNDGIEPLVRSGRGILSCQIDSAPFKSRIQMILESILAITNNVKTTIQSVIRELGDEMLAFEVSEGSIAAYAEQNGHNPFMPISLSAYALLAPYPAAIDNILNTRNASRSLLSVIDVRTKSKLFMRQHPINYYDVATPEFKFAYGNRGILGARAPISSLVGSGDIMKLYNNSVDASGKIAPDVYGRFVSNIVDAVRFVYTVNNESKLLTYTAPKFSINGQTLQQRLGNAAVLPMRAGTRVEKLIGLVESSDSGASMRDYLSIGAGESNRSQERVSNIVDLNIVPFNYHAMMHDIPLVNLYNYEYTFDQLTGMTFGVGDVERSHDAVVDGGADDIVRAFVNLTINPYAAVTDFALNANGAITAIMRGDSGLGMGRPKFISDQLYNKSLLRSIWLQPVASGTDIIGAQVFGKNTFSARGPSALTFNNNELATITDVILHLGMTINSMMLVVSTQALNLNIYYAYKPNIMTFVNNTYQPDQVSASIGPFRHTNGHALSSQFTTDLDADTFAEALASNTRTGTLRDPIVPQVMVRYATGVNVNTAYYVGQNVYAQQLLTTLYQTLKSLVHIFDVNANTAGSDLAPQVNNTILLNAGIIGSVGGGYTIFTSDGIFGPATNGQPFNSIDRWEHGVAALENIIRIAGKNISLALMSIWQNIKSLYNVQAQTLSAINYNQNIIANIIELFTGISCENITNQRTLIGARVGQTTITSEHNIINVIETCADNVSSPRGLFTVMKELAKSTDSNTPISKITYLIGLVATNITLFDIESNIYSHPQTFTDYVPLLAAANQYGPVLVNVVNDHNVQAAGIKVTLQSATEGPSLQVSNVGNVLVYRRMNLLDVVATVRTDAAAYLTPSAGNTPLQSYPANGQSGQMIAANASVRIDASKNRFDTIFIRNLIFVTNVSRVVRLRLMRALALDRQVLVKSHAAIAPGLTEYGFDPYTPNELLGSRAHDGRQQFVNRDDDMF